jgi:hypothetical protein
MAEAWAGAARQQASAAALSREKDGFIGWIPQGSLAAVKML